MRTLLGITVIGVVALACLNKELDGQLIALAIVAISGLAGYELREELKIRRGEGGSN